MGNIETGLRDGGGYFKLRVQMTCGTHEWAGCVSQPSSERRKNRFAGVTLSTFEAAIEVFGDSVVSDGNFSRHLTTSQLGQKCCVPGFLEGWAYARSALELHDAPRALAVNGVGMNIGFFDPGELVSLCDRLVVMRRGVTTAHLVGTN